MRSFLLVLGLAVFLACAAGLASCGSGNSSDADEDGDRDNLDPIPFEDGDDSPLEDGDETDEETPVSCPQCADLPGRYCLNPESICPINLELAITELAPCRYQFTLTRDGAFLDQTVTDCPTENTFSLSGYWFEYVNESFNTSNDTQCVGFFDKTSCGDSDGDEDADLDDEDGDATDGDTDGDDDNPPSDGDAEPEEDIQDLEPGECNAGEVRCVEGVTLEVCSDDEQWETWQSCDSDAGERCDNERNQCLTDCELHLQENSNLGCVFWAVNLANYGNEGYDGGSTAPNYNGHVRLFVSNPNEEDATLTLRTREGIIELGENATVAAHASVVIELPQEAAGAVTDKYVVDGGRIQYAGFRLSATLPVFVYQFNPSAMVIRSSDASLLLPESTLGTLYHAMSVPHSYKRIDSATYHHPSGFVVVGTQENTTVTVTAKGPTSALSIPTHDETALSETHDLTQMESGETRTFTLNAHEVLSLETRNGFYCATIKESDPVHGRNCIKWDDFTKDVSCYIYGRMFCQPGPDLSGSVVQSDKPVAVFGTAKNAMVPYYMFGTEHLEEQLFPTSTWGSEYVLGRQAPRYRYYTCSRGNMATNHTSTCPYGSAG